MVETLNNLSMMMSSVMSKEECKNSLNIFLKFYPEPFADSATLEFDNFEKRGPI